MVFIHRDKGKVNQLIIPSRFPVALTMFMLTGQICGLRNWYPIKGNIQRMMQRTRLSHICGSIRVFLATPVNNEPRGE